MTRTPILLFLVWFTIAPAIANACAMGCESDSSGSVHYAEPSGGDMPDCHDASNERNDESGATTHDAASMAAACLVAAAAPMPAPGFSALIIEIDTHLSSALLLPPASFEASPPSKPPRA